MNKYMPFFIAVPCVFLVVTFIVTERKGVKLKELMPVVVMSAAAIFGRVIFSFIPQVQPVTAIVIIMGVCYGCGGGFLTGALTALVSNLFLGMGPWTLWQMTAWGIIGLVSGLLGKYAFCKKIYFLIPFSVISAFFFSIVTDLWTVASFSEQLTLGTAATIFTAGLVFNISHAVGNAVFVALLYKPLSRKIDRVKRKYEILCT